MGATAAIIRTSVLGAALTVGGYGVYRFVSDRDLRRTIAEMEQIQAEMQERLAVREAMIERLNRSERLAHLHVVGQQLDPDGTVADTELLFIELDEGGTEIARQEFTVPGDMVFVDAWSVKFHPEDVAEGHPMRGQTLLLLQRIYSDQMAPRHGYALDVPGAIPPAYATGEAAEFEQRVWEHFWDLATNPKAAEALGVRVAQGEAVYKPVRQGDVYELKVDATGGMSLVPLPQDPVAGGGST